MSAEDRLLKPLPFSGDPELRSLAQTISRDIYVENPNVHWEDVVSLEGAKRLLKESVVIPIKYPQLFTGLLSPWMGVLLYGPPGTGKTMLAKAVATECSTTFFNISASSIVSKYRGDSEKLVRVLFDLARYHAPSTIFLDEIDSIMSHRGSSDGMSEHEGSRRMKTELLIQMDGLAKNDAIVFVLAASNIPWELDSAMLRRLEKRIMVDLPDVRGRETMVRKLLVGPSFVDIDPVAVAERTEKFSGADIRLLCKEVAMKPVRRIIERLDKMEYDMKTDDGAGPSELEVQKMVRAEPATLEDMEEALSCTRPSTQMHKEKYINWTNDYGSG